MRVFGQACKKQNAMKIKNRLPIFILFGYLIIIGCGKNKEELTKHDAQGKLIAQNYNMPKKINALPTITKFTGIDKGFSILSSAMRVTGISKVLDSKGSYTIFAPANVAFDRFSGNTIKKWLLPENSDKLNEILKCHIVPQVLGEEELVNSIRKNGGSVKLETLGGELLTVTLKRNRIFLIDKNGNGGTLMTTDVEASNGLIHTLDNVMMPKK